MTKFAMPEINCNDPVSVLGFVPGIVDGLFMIDCGPGLMDMLFV